jgi:hypothetical protein
MRFGEGGAEPGVAFVLGNGDAADIGNDKVGPGNADLCLDVFFSQFFPRDEGQLFGCEAGAGVQLFIKQFRHVFFALVHGRGYDVVRRFAIELLDIFAEIGLDAFDAVFFEEMVELDLFGDHALALDDAAAAFLLTDSEDLFECLGGVLCPDDAAASAGKDRLEFFQLLVKGLDGAPLDVFCSFACEGQFCKLLLALRDDSIIAADIEIDLFAVVQVLRLDGAAGNKVSCVVCHG